MSGSSNIVAMKKIVQQLRFEANINRVKVSLLLRGLSSGSRTSAVLHAERTSRPFADWSVFEHKPIQDTKALLVCVKPYSGSPQLSLARSCDLSAGGKMNHCHNL
ncbi:hypothetical protein P4O66_017148 [Electrophorus voltai]|uniref:G protein gamma domain-containing protein n=1 Tax=Electrophorus voltai TaxID=2609070 RepID=A0AAD8YVG5_9TELE|nr:hypothetical protein P4O66_017148 [Electrophorus voltai]